MSVAAPSPWSAEQRRWLQALGHAVLRIGGGDAEAGEASAEPDVQSQAPVRPVTPAASVTGGQPAPGRSVDTVARRASPAPPDMAAEARAGVVMRRAPPVPEEAVDGLPAAGAAARAGAMRRPATMPDRLRLALLRASGLDPADPAAQEAMAQWPVERLRGDAVAKRAFWPQLRALRKRST